MEEGLQKGLEKGLEKGRLLEARSNIRMVLSVRFPDLGDAKALDRVTDTARLESIFRAVLMANDEKDAQAALRKLTAKRTNGRRS